MKAGIHPEYETTTIACACGAAIQTRSTKKNIHIEICSKCHPFFTGDKKYVDTLSSTQGGKVRIHTETGTLYEIIFVCFYSKKW